MYQDKMFIFGGNNGKYLNDLWVYKFDEQKGPVIPVHSLEDDMNNLLNNEKYSDVSFEVEGKKIFAHRNILAIRSNYFANLFDSGMRESTNNVIKMDDTASHAAVYTLLQYLYTGKVNVSADTAFEVMKLAEGYLLERLKFLCEEIVIQAIDIESAPSLLMEAEHYACTQLKLYCIEFIQLHKDSIDKEALKILPKELLLEIYLNEFKGLKK